ncbi:hypothetical protein CB0940_02433 [Cercospora beticola]|uniref:Uncharacterized protein n=1 Tax=Cercospora beticola TaxID=122368 RepID=A0A2G5I4C7_CERBT|nr:hypothetical protein CB0940_02433 [Cercospora beticola]PIA99657.1 hypothetical protein CB0940_02433 [Cercospora beticola]
MCPLQTPAPTSEASSALVARLPSKHTIAFAMTVVRYKPPELKYIKLLRQHIAKGRRENALSSVYSHLDRSAYWRSEAERGRAALRSAEKEAIDLRREIATLKGKLDNRPSSPVKKRKKVDADVILVPRSPKKAKRTASPMRNGPLVTDLTIEEEYSQAGEIGTKLLRAVFHILEALKPGRRTETDELAYHIERACSVIPSIVQEELDKLIADSKAGEEQSKAALTIATRALATILAGYTRLGKTQPQSPGSSVPGKVTYAMVVMFRKLVEQLTVLSDRGATKKENVDDNVLASTNARPSTARPANSHAKGGISRPSTARPSSPKKAKAKTPARAKNPKDERVKENPVLALYTTFLGKVIDMIDPKMESNHALFEGFTYCVLNHLGKRLYTIVFGKSRAPTLEAEIKQGIDGHPDETSPDPISAPELTHEQKQTRLEAPYLLHLLNRVMIAVPAFYGNVHGIKNSGKTKNVNKAPAKNTLAISAKECLQRTLVNCMFGTEGVVDDPFKEYLRMPGPGEATMTVPKIKEVDVTKHFQEEVWRCLGWDILAKEGEW